MQLETAPKCRILRAQEPLSNVHPHDENGHLEGNISETQIKLSS